MIKSWPITGIIRHGYSEVSLTSGRINRNRNLPEQLSGRSGAGSAKTSHGECRGGPVFGLLFGETTASPHNGHSDVHWRIQVHRQGKIVGDGLCHPAEKSQDCNIILSQTYEYRLPSVGAVEEASAFAGASASSMTVKLDMTSRFLGLIVVPGQHITKIEAEES